MSFIFQSIPERYNLQERLKEGLRVAWVASRYRDYMKKGEIVYFWLAGDESIKGVYGWGRILEDPKPDEQSGYRVKVQYICSFLERDPRRHIPSAVIKKDPLLSQNLLFRMPIGTNFLLTEKEDAALKKIIAKELGAEYLPPDTKAKGGANDE